MTEFDEKCMMKLMYLFGREEITLDDVFRFLALKDYGGILELYPEEDK